MSFSMEVIEEKTLNNKSDDKEVINTTLTGNTLNELMLEFFNKIMSIRHDINHSIHIVDDEMEANFDAWSRGLLH